jgi:hypothetical protein
VVLVVETEADVVEIVVAEVAIVADLVDNL